MSSVRKSTEKHASTSIQLPRKELQLGSKTATYQFMACPVIRSCGDQDTRAEGDLRAATTSPRAVPSPDRGKCIDMPRMEVTLNTALLEEGGLVIRRSSSQAETC
jgi:hypothetical protein